MPYPISSSARMPQQSSVIPHSRPFLGEHERDAVLATIERGWVGAGGPESHRFSRDLANLLRQPVSLPVSSGTVALEIALRVVGVQGHRVALPAFACMSIHRAVTRAGGVPYLVDVDPIDLSFPSDCLESVARTCSALILIHQFGLPAGCARHVERLSLAIVEDVTAGVGATVGAQHTGRFGRLTVLSLAATKMLCAGEGGAIAGRSSDIEHARRWINPESALPLAEAVPNAKLSDVACALGRSQLGKLAFFLDRRATIASYYDQALGESSERVLRPRAADTGTWWRYLIAVGPDNPERVIARAVAKGVGFARPVTSRWWAASGHFPVSDRLHSTLVSVPLYPSLTDAEVDRVADTLRQLVAS